MSEPLSIPDQEAREAAATTFDRNVVVIAGAGTGKTTLLVNRLLYLLMRRPDPLALSRIVALTFTNKAAAEMKVRLRERLRALVNERDREGEAAGGGAVSVADLRRRYGWTIDEIVARAETALRDLDKAQIGTLHSFAAHLLRLYPIEAGVAPTFKTDEDGSRFDDHFAMEWDLWLDCELGATGRDHARWRTLLKSFRLQELYELAYGLHNDLIDLEGLTAQVREGELSVGLMDWFAQKHRQAEALLLRYDSPKRRKVESMLAALVQLYGLLLDRGLTGPEALSLEAREALEKDLGTAPTGWTDDDFDEVKALQRVALRLLSVDHGVMEEVLEVLVPFVQAVRLSFRNSGWLTFDGLLAKARGLLRDHPSIREQLKREYRALLVDEFQDTDPVQYEIVLYLAEQLGRQATSWREARLEEGKLFIVGDPKQSIYAFRRADIEAFDHVVARLEDGGALRCELATNFRSHQSVLEVVNGVFDALLVAQPSVQPPNVPLAVQPNRTSPFRNAGVELRLVRADQDDDLDSAAATRVEAEQVALLIARLLTEAEEGAGAAGSESGLRPGHIALLFRKLTQTEPYLESLRRQGIDFTIDGEKHFYCRQEVIDLVNLLRSVANPHDGVAFLGILRAPLGGLSDQQLLELRERGALDYRRIDRLSGWDHPQAETIGRLYRILSQLHTEAPLVPLPEAVDLLFQRLPLLELAAASLHGEQAVANLLKVRRMAEDLADRPGLSLTEFVELFITRLEEQPEEAESALAEDTLDAVRILTIHKAKGLEFPVVILAGLHHGDGASRGPAGPVIWHDWSTGVQGVEFGDRCSIGAVLVAEKARVREQAERRRLFYVGMTRARERLVLSGALPKRRVRGALLDLLERAVGSELGLADQDALSVGQGAFRQVVVPGEDGPPARQRPRSAEWEPGVVDQILMDRWAERDRVWAERRSEALVVSPSDFIEKLTVPVKGVPRSREEAVSGKAVGTLVHRLLQHWDFAGDPARQLAQLDQPPLLPEAEAVRTILATFIDSPAYERLQRATLVGREVPFLIPWNEGRQILEGVIDVLYRLDGRLWIADYKTDMIPRDQVEARAALYREQARLYRRAVETALGEPVAGFEFIFLRHGLIVPG